MLPRSSFLAFQPLIISSLICERGVFDVDNGDDVMEETYIGVLCYISTKREKAHFSEVSGRIPID